MAKEVRERKDCPICGRANNCNINQDCWCGNEFFPKEIFDLVSQEKLGKSCICKDCLDQFSGRGDRSSDLF